ncbi:hypothetical protein Pla163_04360 [Planctomycetes bacterium Pla163]|uniref:Lipoprotein n=1 Tax=Rohdeia mirabilis TaxID=2528008 RepID=A0A518CVT2_9BACT|nr:hypothetical protein Pla163_04360 [Planctomycetes bacterium Pla163]
MTLVRTTALLLALGLCSCGTLDAGNTSSHLAATQLKPGSSTRTPLIAERAGVRADVQEASSRREDQRAPLRFGKPGYGR